MAGVAGALFLISAAMTGNAKADGPHFSKASLKGDYMCNMTGSADDFNTGSFTDLSFATVESYDGHGNFLGHGWQVAPPYPICTVVVGGAVQVNSDGTGLRSAGYGLCGANVGDSGTYPQAIVIERNGARYDLVGLGSGFVLSAYCIRRDSH